MGLKDFEGIQKFKIIILAIVIALIGVNLVGPLFYYETYLKVFIMVQQFYMLRVAGYVVLTAIATVKAFKIL